MRTSRPRAQLPPTTSILVPRAADDSSARAVGAGDSSTVKGAVACGSPSHCWQATIVNVAGVASPATASGAAMCPVASGDGDANGVSPSLPSAVRYRSTAAPDAQPSPVTSTLVPGRADGRSGWIVGVGVVATVLETSNA